MGWRFSKVGEQTSPSWYDTYNMYGRKIWKCWRIYPSRLMSNSGRISWETWTQPLLCAYHYSQGREIQVCYEGCAKWIDAKRNFVSRIMPVRRRKKIHVTIRDLKFWISWQSGARSQLFRVLGPLKGTIKLVNFPTNDEVRNCCAFVVARVTQNIFSSSGITKLVAFSTSCIKTRETRYKSDTLNFMYIKSCVGLGILRSQII